MHEYTLIYLNSMFESQSHSICKLSLREVFSVEVVLFSPCTVSVGQWSPTRIIQGAPLGLLTMTRHWMSTGNPSVKQIHLRKQKKVKILKNRFGDTRKTRNQMRKWKRLFWSRGLPTRSRKRQI